MNVDVMIDVENEIQSALSPYVTAYCRPLPKTLALPSVEIRKIGGTETNTIDTFMVMLYARAETEYDADLLARKATGLLIKIADEQTTALRYVTINSLGGWSADPVRPDLAMCTVTLMVRAHKTIMEVKRCQM